MTPAECLAKALRTIEENEVAFFVFVKPGQKKEYISTGDDGSVVLRINAPAQEGRANERVIEFLADALGKPKRDISVARGQLSRHKEIRIKNAGVVKVLRALLAHVQS